MMCRFETNEEWKEHILSEMRERRAERTVMKIKAFLDARFTKRMGLRNGVK